MDERPPGRVDRARRWITARRRHLEAMRPERIPVEVGFRVLERDVRVAGGVLGGGLAYRLFFWTLALTVLVAGGLGFASAGGVDVENRAQDAELTQQLAQTIAEAAKQSQAARWWLLVVGIASVIWFAWSLLRAVRLVHAAAWNVPPGPAFPRPGSLLGVISVPVVLIAVTTAAGWLNSLLGIFGGLLAFAVSVVLLIGLVTLIFTRLPAPPVPWTAHLPGAVALVVGMQVILIFLRFYLAERLANAQEIYGALGLAATVLFGLYVIARTIVWSVELNAVVWEVRQERKGVARPADPPVAGTP